MPVSKSSSGSVLATNCGTASSVDTYLKSAFKHDLDVVRVAMEKTARSYSAAELRGNAMNLYERFRPAYRGWGVKSELHIKDIRSAGK